MTKHAAEQDSKAKDAKAKEAEAQQAKAQQAKAQQAKAKEAKAKEAKAQEARAIDSKATDSRPKRAGLPDTRSSGEKALGRKAEKDLRRSPRLNVELAVDYTSEHNFFAGQTGNIGTGGLFIVCDAPLPVGTSLSVKLALPHHEVRAQAEVVWTAEAPPGGPGLSGMGVRFDQLSRLDEAKIESFIRQREPLLYEEADIVDEAWDAPSDEASPPAAALPPSARQKRTRTPPPLPTARKVEPAGPEAPAPAASSDLGKQPVK